MACEPEPGLDLDPPRLKGIWERASVEEYVPTPEDDAEYEAMLQALGDVTDAT